MIRRTLRSGQMIQHAGPVVVFGDVNDGAQIVAAGDVLVFGKVRGLVHAGAGGDEHATIAALTLNPPQTADRESHRTGTRRTQAQSDQSGNGKCAQRSDCD